MSKCYLCPEKSALTAIDEVTLCAMCAALPDARAGVEFARTATEYFRGGYQDDATGWSAWMASRGLDRDTVASLVKLTRPRVRSERRAMGATI
jgi:hypothetical protein